MLYLCTLVLHLAKYAICTLIKSSDNGVQFQQAPFSRGPRTHIHQHLFFVFYSLYITMSRPIRFPGRQDKVAATPPLVPVRHYEHVSSARTLQGCC